MEDDDGFGDLYADVLGPLPSSSAVALSAPPPHPSTSASAIPLAQFPSLPIQTVATAAAADVDEAEDEWLLGPAPPTLKPPPNWATDDDGIEAKAKESHLPDRIKVRVFEEEKEAAGVSQISDEEDHVPVIPGLAAAPAALRPAPQSKPLASDDWDSDSEDDLQIVLNETDDGQLGGGRDGIEDGDDEDGGDDLVIVTDESQHHHLPTMEEQDWAEEAAQGGGEGERKELGEAVKGTGPVGAAPGMRTGYSNHGFHPQHHSMFKYIRPGVAPASEGSLGGALGSSGQVRPPLTLGPVAGRGRGEWRPAGGRGSNVQKGFHSSYGVSTWGSSSGRAFGSGLDFTLPPYKTVFDIDIDGFEEKPWRYPGADISDFFNFDLDEDKWKDYCKQLDQLRLEATMQSKIRVYESGRSDQEYDPDLPPELAAAAGHPNVSADNGHCSQKDNGQIDFSGQGRGLASVRPPIPTGRAIQVEGGYGERLPSIDTRPPRMRDSDAVIEIVLQDSLDDSTVYTGAFEPTEKDFQGERMKGGHEVGEDEKHATSGYADHFPHTFTDRKREAMRKAPFPPEGGDILHLSTEAHSQYTSNSKMRSPVHDGAYDPQGERLSQGTSCGRHSSTSGKNLSDIIPRKPANSSRHDDRKKKELVEGREINETSGTSLVAAGAAKEPSIEDRYDEHGDKLALGDSVEAGEDITSDFHMPNESPSDDNLVLSGKRQKIFSQVEQPAVFDNDDEDEARTPHSDSSKAKSWSSKDSQNHPERGEMKRDGGSWRVTDLRRRHAEEERNDHRKTDYNRDTRVEMDRNRMASKEREDIFRPGAHRDWKATSHPVHGQSLERPKEIQISQRREDNLHSRRVGDEDIRREYSAEADVRRRGKVRPADSNDKNENLHLKKMVDEEDWRQLRKNKRDDIVISHHESFDDSYIKIKNEENSRIGKADREDILHGYRGRDHPSQRKREIDVAIDERRREANGRMRDKAEDYPVKQKDVSWHPKEREDRQRPKQSYENTLTHREREERRTIRSGRAAEDEPLAGNSRNKDNMRSASYDKDYQGKDRGRQNEVANRNRIGEENLMKLKGHSDVHPRDKHLNNDGRKSRHERLGSYNDRPSSTTDSHQARGDRHNVSTRKRKSSENNGRNPQGPSKRRHEDHNDQLNEKVDKKSTTGQLNRNVPSTILSKKNNNQILEQRESSQLNHSSMTKREADAASDNDNQEDSRRGRSKLERWTSHKEREYSIIDNKEKFSTSTRPKEIEASNVNAVHNDEVGKPVANDAVGNSDLKGGDAEHIVDKLEVQDRHLDTVAKLKRRSERFKLPMPGEKETSLNRRVDSELQLLQNENAADVEVKPERPARKRRWTGS